MRLVAVMMLMLTICVAAYAEDLIVKVYVNSKVQRYDPPARVRNGRTYVPLRQGGESLGYEVKWIAEQNMAQVCSDTACVFIPKKEGIIVNGRLFLPLRKMGEALGAKVKWDEKKKVVLINKKREAPRFD